MLRSIGHTAEDATQLAGAFHDINQSPDPVGTYAKVAQETAGQGAGQALTALATEGIGKAVPAIAGAAADAASAVGDKVAPAVRATTRAVNTALAKAPVAAASAAGYALGHATGLPEAGTVGAGIGAFLAKDIPGPRIPGEGFGLPNRVTGGPATISPEVEPPTSPAAPAPETPAAAAAAPDNLPNTGNLGAKNLSGESALRDVLSRQDNANLLKIARSRGINVTQEAQLKPSATVKATGKDVANTLIDKIADDFSQEELDDLRANYIENHRTLDLGQGFLDKIGAEGNKTLALKTFFPDVKVPASTMRRTLSALSAAKDSPSAVASPADLLGRLKQQQAVPAPETPSVASDSGDLLGLLKKSVKQAKTKKALRDLQ
jgi:hypothetical protein